MPVEESPVEESPFDEKTLALLDRPWPYLAAEDLCLSSGFKHRLLQEYIYRLWCKHTCLAVASRSPSAPERFRTRVRADIGCHTSVSGRT